MENILSGNPLINLAGQQQQQQQQMNQTQNTFRVKRRYLTTQTFMHNMSDIFEDKSSLHFPQIFNNTFVNVFLGGTTMLCSRIAPKEWMKHGRRNALSMTRCALSSTRNLWRNM